MNYRAYWGGNLINYGADGTASRYYMGAIPSERDQWVKLEVPASVLGLEGAVISGWAYTLYSGSIYWDYSGVETGINSTSFWVEDALPAGATPLANNGDTWTWNDEPEVLGNQFARQPEPDGQPRALLSKRQ